MKSFIQLRILLPLFTIFLAAAITAVIKAAQPMVGNMPRNWPNERLLPSAACELRCICVFTACNSSRYCRHAVVLGVVLAV